MHGQQARRVASARDQECSKGLSVIFEDLAIHHCSVSEKAIETSLFAVLNPTVPFFRTIRASLGPVEDFERGGIIAIRDSQVYRTRTATKDR